MTGYFLIMGELLLLTCIAPVWVNAFRKARTYAREQRERAARLVAEEHAKQQWYDNLRPCCKVYQNNSPLYEVYQEPSGILYVVANHVRYSISLSWYDHGWRTVQPEGPW